MAAQVYEFDGTLYGSEGEYLDALSHEYKTGDQDLVMSSLDEYGFTLEDLGVRPSGA